MSMQALADVSIHAPREGSDPVVVYNAAYDTRFNPRSPRRERQHEMETQSASFTFQSTLPAKGATALSMLRSIPLTVSIHAPREGSDSTQVYVDVPDLPFQSTLPAKGATSGISSGPVSRLVSIHAPREGSDG